MKHINNSILSSIKIKNELNKYLLSLKKEYKALRIYDETYSMHIKEENVITVWFELADDDTHLRYCEFVVYISGCEHFIFNMDKTVEEFYSVDELSSYINEVLKVFISNI